jgi:hypothetical protein
MSGLGEFFSRGHRVLVRFYSSLVGHSFYCPSAVSLDGIAKVVPSVLLFVFLVFSAFAERLD